MKFFVLQSRPTGKDEIARTDALEVDGTQTGDAPRCEACGDYIGMRQWLPPFRVELDTWGRCFGDLAFATAWDMLVSQRFKELWQEHGLTGLSGFEPVEVVKVRRHRKLVGKPPQYFRVNGEFGGVTLDEKASGVEWDVPPTCSVCRMGNLLKRFKAVVVVPGTWSGRDILIPTWSAHYLVSERFKNFCEVNNITNAVFYPAEEFGHDYYPWEKTTE